MCIKRRYSLLPIFVAFLAVTVASLMSATHLYAQNNSPLCFTARNGSVTVKFDIKNATHAIQYSTDGMSWSAYTSNQEVALSTDQSVYFRAESNQDSAVAFANSTVHSHFDFTSTNGGTIEGSGNIMSLYGPNCPDLPLQPYAFAAMFDGCTSLTEAPELPATTIADFCYAFMFRGCTSLTEAPALPAITLADNCYELMFYDCTSLVTVPDLPATTLTDSCYYGMFWNCSALTTTPSLPATTLAAECYEAMFMNCASLTTASSLPATTLADYCYAYMFLGCTSLTTAPAVSATTLANHSCYSMFMNCASLTTASSLPATTLAYYCYGYMFKGCTALTEAPSLPTTTLAKKCYAHMFEGCTSLTEAPSLPATTLADSCYYVMFKDCASLTTIPALPATTLKYRCYYEMFEGCTSLIVNETAPGKQWLIPAPETASGSLTNMFSGTSGTMNGTPQLNTIYYIASDPTIAIEDVEADVMEYVVYSNNRQIVVRGAEGHTVTLYDINGRVVAQTANVDNIQNLTVSAAGIYLVGVDKMKSVKKVVVR